MTGGTKIMSKDTNFDDSNMSSQDGNREALSVTSRPMCSAENGVSSVEEAIPSGSLRTESGEVSPELRSRVDDEWHSFLAVFPSSERRAVLSIVREMLKVGRAWVLGTSPIII